MKRELYLDGSTIHSVDAFHDQVQELFGLPHYYGRNLDDLWECLTSYINPNIRLIIHDFQNLLSVFGPEAEAVKDIFEKLPNHKPEIEILLN